MKFKLKYEHIKYGKPKRTDTCPIALCIAEKFPNSIIEICDDVIKIDDIEYQTPKIVENFIFKFDEYNGEKEISPFQYSYLPPKRGDFDEIEFELPVKDK